MSFSDDRLSIYQRLLYTALYIYRVEFSFARSSGPGGQNVNKLNTKAEVRFHVSSADWLDSEVRGRLLEYQSNKVNKDGELVITSQEHRCHRMTALLLYHDCCCCCSI